VKLLKLFNSALREWCQRLAGSVYWKSVGKLSGAALVAQALSFGVSLLVARHYSPAMTGQLGVMTAMLGIIVPVSCLRYELALPLPEKDADAVHLFRLLLQMVGVAAILSLIFCAAAVLLPAFNSVFELGWLLWFLPFIVLVSGVLNCLSMWCNRIGAFHILSRIRVLSVILNGVTVLAAGLVGSASSFWLILGLFISGLGCVFYVLQGLRASGTGPAPLKLRPEWGLPAVKLLKQFKQFPQFNAPMTLLDQAAAMSPALLFAAYFSTSVTGQFNLCLSVLRIPASLLGAAVAQVFYFRAAKLLKERAELWQLVWRTSVLLIMVAVPMVAVLAAFGPALFEWVFSAKWRTSGEFSQVMVWSSAMLLILSPTSMLPSLLNLQHKHFVIAAGSSVLRVGFLWWGCTTGEVMTALVWFTLAELMGGVVYVVWVIRELSLRPAPASPQSS
jgi:O-antigen/teichoic acid export membrane protein